MRLKWRRRPVLINGSQSIHSKRLAALPTRRVILSHWTPRSATGVSHVEHQEYPIIAVGIVVALATTACANGQVGMASNQPLPAQTEPGAVEAVGATEFGRNREHVVGATVNLRSRCCSAMVTFDDRIQVGSVFLYRRERSTKWRSDGDPTMDPW